PGVTLTKQAMKAMYGWPAACETRTPDSHVSRLRRKLAPYGIRIVNVWGYGWYLTAPDGTRAAS
ncbi:MAG: winged helix-turn-helix domain-containing protein, partial [Haloechinothrix sp.]